MGQQISSLFLTSSKISTDLLKLTSHALPTPIHFDSQIIEPLPDASHHCQLMTPIVPNTVTWTRYTAHPWVPETLVNPSYLKIPLQIISLIHAYLYFDTTYVHVTHQSTPNSMYFVGAWRRFLAPKPPDEMDTGMFKWIVSPKDPSKLDYAGFRPSAFCIHTPQSRTTFRWIHSNFIGFTSISKERFIEFIRYLQNDLKDDKTRSSFENPINSGGMSVHTTRSTNDKSVLDAYNELYLLSRRPNRYIRPWRRDAKYNSNSVAYASTNNNELVPYIALKANSDTLPNSDTSVWRQLTSCAMEKATDPWCLKGNRCLAHICHASEFERNNEAIRSIINPQGTWTTNGEITDWTKPTCIWTPNKPDSNIIYPHASSSTYIMIYNDHVLCEPDTEPESTIVNGIGMFRIRDLIDFTVRSEIVIRVLQQT